MWVRCEGPSFWIVAADGRSWKASRGTTQISSGRRVVVLRNFINRTSLLDCKS